MALSNKVLLGIIFVLFVALMLNVFFGCRSIQEGFEAKEMTEEAIAAISEMDPKKAAKLVKDMLQKKGVLSESDQEESFETTEEEPAETSEVEPSSKPQKKESSSIVKDMLAKEDTNEKRPLTKKEMELFEAISKEQVSNEDLEKLVKAGIVTESLIERFLSTLQEDASTTSDAVVEGFSCQRDFATF